MSSKHARNLFFLLAVACSATMFAASSAPAQDEPQMAPETRAGRVAREALEAQAAPDDARAMQATLPVPGRCVPPPPDLDAWYPFDGNGNDLILGKNATPNGPVSFPGAVVQRGALLSANAFLTIAPGPVLNQGLGDFSIDFWLFVPKAWLPGPHPVRTLIEKRVNAGGTRGYSLFVYNSRLGLQLADGSPTNYGQPGTSPVLTPGWNHVAVTVDRDNPSGITFYRNAAATANGNPTNRQGNLDNNAPTLIGRNAFGDGGPSTGAVFDEVEFFDRVLQPGEIKAIYAAGRAGKCKPG
jgi:Concanavalin A-like lectin/glucanases superfamily